MIAPANPASRPAYQRVLAHVRSAVARSRVGSRVSLMLRNQCAEIVGRSLFDGFEAHANGESLLCRTLRPHVRTFADVGANVGNWSAEMLDPPDGIDRRGILFEPAAYAVEKLRARCGGRRGVEIVQAAVSDAVGEATFFEGSDGSEQSSLLARDGDCGTRARTVRVTTIDREMEQRGIRRLGLLKIDTEGYDLHVLRGAAGMLAAQRVGVVQFEYNSPWRAAGNTLAAAVSLMDRFGYSVYLLRRGGLFRLDFDRYGEFFSYANFVAVSRDSRPLLTPLLRGTL